MLRKGPFRDSPHPLIAAISGHAGGVILISGALAVVVVIIVALLQVENLDLAAWIGLIGTLWALFLAMLIYLLTAKDADRLLDELDSLRGALDGIADEIGRAQTPEALTLAKANYRGYVDALLAEYPTIPLDRVIWCVSLTGRAWRESRRLLRWVVSAR